MQFSKLFFILFNEFASLSVYHIGKGIFDNIHRLYDYDNSPPENDFIHVLQYIIQELKKMDQDQTVTLEW